MKDMGDILTEDSDSDFLETIRVSAEVSEAFLATSSSGKDRFKESIYSRGDCFDRSGIVSFEDDGEVILQIPVASLPATIGSSEQADFRLGFYGISRLHCHLESIGNLVRIVNDNSTNGVILNHKKILQEELCDGDQIKLGAVTLRIRKR